MWLLPYLAVAVVLVALTALGLWLDRQEIRREAARAAERAARPPFVIPRDAAADHHTWQQLTTRITDPEQP